MTNKKTRLSAAFLLASVMSQGVAYSPKGMVFVRAGEFTMGTSIDINPDEGFNAIFDKEKPEHKVYLSAFWIDTYDVKVEQYMRCVVAKKCKRPGDLQYQKVDEPVTSVTWYDANDYCTFVGKRLPTEAEWEKTARGPKNSVNPWGDRALSEEYEGIIGYYEWDVSGYGAYHMGLGLAQWTADWFGEDYYKHSPAKNPTGPTKGDKDSSRGLPMRSIRGRMYKDYRTSYLAIGRFAAPPNERMPYVTFRCAKSSE